MSPIVQAAVAAQGVALAVLVGADGSPGWRLVRDEVVAAVTAAALRVRSCALVGALGAVAVAVGAGIGPRSVAAGSTASVRRAGWYVPSRNGAAVGVRHGAGSTKDDELDHAAVLARHGYGVLLTDARGHGDSEGRAMDFGWYGDADIAAAVGFLAARDDVEPGRIGVVGMSMGGEEAIGAAAADRIAAVVAEGATARTDADKEWLSDELGARGWLQQRLDWVRYTLTDALADAGKPTPLADAVAAAAPTPVLVIAAGDVVDEVHVAARLAATSPANVSTWTVTGAGHTGGLATSPDEWEARVTGFLDTALRTTHAGRG